VGADVTAAVDLRHLHDLPTLRRPAPLRARRAAAVAEEHGAAAFIALLANVQAALDRLRSAVVDAVDAPKERDAAEHVPARPAVAVEDLPISLILDFEERAAVAEFDGGLDHAAAERLAWAEVTGEDES
jgi:hypothetical protein